MMIAYEQNKYPPLGQLVEVNGENMHVYTKGKGENTIVLLSGAGTAAPALDYEPLMNEMAKNNRIVVIETFGYGWSDITNKERTVENIVKEIRDALKKANIDGPYILMPHSVSGIYSMYYANKYPDEIKAIIGIDCTLPQVVKYFNESAPTMPRYLSVAAPTGIARLVVNMNPEKYLPIADKGTYSDDNLKMTKSISAWNLGNKNIVAEVNEMNHNIDKTIDMAFPSKIPVMIFTDKDDKVTEDGKTIVSFYQTQISHLPSNKLVVLEGHHYLHWSRFKEISETVNNFIDTF
ncbi:alpha/beta hydrolase [Bacillus cereus]|uniref:Alpha/beta hydrolase n=2 Tax=Bacillus cereus TaxID=1396 RepID=A0AA44TEC0_BACCE|nr:alpha/beta hydrolase [Bacillus cereus]PFN02954.1 alpha/beta hydrolase [Bacillus cereus]PFS00473.1 alpha/beta hydrolase [Bacillus cereus]